MSQPPLPSPAPYTCPRCGAAVEEKVPFCPACGAAMRVAGKGAINPALLTCLTLLLLGGAGVFGAAGACFMLFANPSVGGEFSSGYLVGYGIGGAFLAAAVGCLIAIVLLFKRR